jgi:hypothetical protein
LNGGCIMNFDGISEGVGRRTDYPRTSEIADSNTQSNRSNWINTPRVGILESTRRIFVKIFANAESNSKVFSLCLQDRIKKDLDVFLKNTKCVLYEIKALHPLGADCHLRAVVVDVDCPNGSEKYKNILCIDRQVKQNIDKSIETIFEYFNGDSNDEEVIRLCVYLEFIRRILSCLINERDEQDMFKKYQLLNAKMNLSNCFEKKYQDTFCEMIFDKDFVSFYRSICT